MAMAGSSNPAIITPIRVYFYSRIYIVLNCNTNWSVEIGRYGQDAAGDRKVTPVWIVALCR
jgi:hypothetical protein